MSVNRQPDVGFFSKKLHLVLRDIHNYTSEELALELQRLANAAGSKLVFELSASQDREAELREKLEASEARIKASQEKRHIGWAFTYQEWVSGKQENFSIFGDTENVPNNEYAWFKVYAQPPIPPELTELQRENTELHQSLRVMEYAMQLVKEENAKLSKLLESSVPEGWQLVPKEPTEDMVQALKSDGELKAISKSDCIHYSYKVSARYAAMLLAAPQPKEIYHA